MIPGGLTVNRERGDFSIESNTDNVMNDAVGELMGAMCVSSMILAFAIQIFHWRGII
jgi:hypothetical protein